ncbi:MAG: ribonuclease T [Gammaproteobacteria bacterium]|jgi:ribonuclease T
MAKTSNKTAIAKRFRGFLPVVVDIETAGLNPETDAILEIAAVILDIDENNQIHPTETHFAHVLPFEDANLDQNALEFNGIDPYQPLRFAVSEQEALDILCKPIRAAMKNTGCYKAVLVGHNPTFDITFLQAAMKRTNYKNNPFHAFTTLDTATLAALAYEHTVLAVAAKRAKIEFEVQQAHSALYDATKTAELFCKIVNQWQKFIS